MVESRFVDVDGGRIHYVVDGDGPPVVLLHGALLNLHLFDAQVDALSQSHTLVRIDLRGYGRSSVPATEPYRYCDDVVAVMDALGLDRAVVGGESFGGAVAMDFAFAHPDRLDGLIFEAAVVFSGWEWHEEFPIKSMFRAFRSGGVVAARQATLDSALLASAMAHPEVAAKLTGIVNGYSGWLFENRDPAVWAEDNAMGRLGEIDVPALVVVGGHDVLDHRLMGQALADGLPRSTGHFWADSGHFPNMEEPDRFDKLVIEFLNTVYPAGIS